MGRVCMMKRYKLFNEVSGAGLDISDKETDDLTSLLYADYSQNLSASRPKVYPIVTDLA